MGNIYIVELYYMFWAVISAVLCWYCWSELSCIVFDRIAYLTVLVKWVTLMWLGVAHVKRDLSIHVW